MKDDINYNEGSSASQKTMILRYLKQGRSLTSLDALNLFGCFRLASRIKNLRDDGWDIRTDTVTDTRTGKRFASYSLAEEPVQLSLF